MKYQTINNYKELKNEIGYTSLIIAINYIMIKNIYYRIKRKV